jgi:tetratricopeptide (TPR) repeat protein
VDDAVARTALVTASPGTGKSRLRREFAKRIAVRAPDAQIVTAASELVGAGTPYGVLGRIVRRLGHVHPSDPPAQQRAALEAHLEAVVPAGERERVIEFLAEACRLPPVEPSARLRAARNDPKRLGEQILRAFVVLIRSECARGPLVLLLEDLQWSDALSVQILDALPRELSDEALLLVAFARPEVRDQFPRLWASAGRTEIALPGLGRKAAERLVRAMRGADVDRATVARIVAQADGNALFLEELIRADAEGRGDALPPSVLAMLQARLSRFEPAIRRLLRAASIFGETFWRGPLASLLLRATDDEEFAGWLQFLADAEIIEQRHESRLVGESEYVFRHALVRDAVYALVADEEREGWHREAARLLVERGESDPLVLAEHHVRAGDLPLACASFLQAAEESLRANDLSGALALVARGLDCQPSPEERGRLLQIRGRALLWSLRWGEALDAVREAFPLLPEGGMPWFEALWDTLTLSGIFGDDVTLERAGAQLLASTPPREAHFVYVQASSTVASMYALRAQREPAVRYLARLEAFAPQLDPHELQARAWLHRARSDHARAFDLDPWLQTREAGEAVRLMAEADNEREWSFFRVFHAHSLGELGRMDAGEAQLRDVLERCARFPDAYIEASGRLHLADLLVDVGVRDGDEARLLEAAELARGVMARSGVSEGYRRWGERLLAACAFARGDLEVAERHTREAIVPTAAALRRLAAVALRVRVLLAMGAHDAAQREAAGLRDWLGAHGTAGYVEVAVRLALAEASEAMGFHEEASAERRAAQVLVARCATRIPEPETRGVFLSSSAAGAAVRRL